jgi:hypothetical protein
VSRRNVLLYNIIPVFEQPAHRSINTLGDLVA